MTTRNIMTGVVTAWLGWLVNAHPNKKLIGYSYLEQIVDLIPSFVMSMAMLVCVLLVLRMEMGLIPTLAMQLVAGVGVYGVLSLILKPAPFRMLAAHLKQRGKDE